MAPNLHPDFPCILYNVMRQLNIDVLTNLQFDIEKFMKDVDPDRIKRKASVREKEILAVQEYAKGKGIDFRTKEYPGMHDGKMRDNEV